MPQQVSENYGSYFAITKSDTVNIPQGITDAIYVGAAGATGTLVAVMETDVTATFVGLAAGTVLKIRAKRVNSGTTTTSSMIALYYGP